MSDPVTADTLVARLRAFGDGETDRVSRMDALEAANRIQQAELAARTNAETVVRQANELRRLAASKSQQKRYDAQQGIERS